MFAPHGARLVGKFLHVNEPHRPPVPRVACPPPFIVLLNAAQRVAAPTSVVAAIGALDNVTEKSHVFAAPRTIYRIDL